jgi:hypothetical protein
MSPSDPMFPVLTVATFVDRTTAVLTGTRLDEFSDGDELYILGVGSTLVPGANVPLVVPKTTLEVTANAGHYLLARSLVQEKPVTIPGLSFGLGEMLKDQVKTVYRRDPIVDKFEFVGNPGALPAAPGDVVIRKNDLAAYLNWLKKQADPAQE